MEAAITSKEIAAVVMVNLGLATYAGLSVWPRENQSYILERGRAIALGLNYKPQEKEAVIARCRQLLDLR